MEREVLHPLGVRVTGVRVGPLGAADVDRLRALLAEHGVVVLPEQDVDDAAFLGFLRSFGPMVFTEGETPLDGYPDLNAVSNVGRTTPPRSVFHVDTSYLREPPAYTALRAVTIPEQGGETVFTDQYRAFDTLPGDLLSHLGGRTVRHVVTGVGEPGAETEAEHPLLRRHPVSGRTALYLSTPERCVSVSGLDEQEGWAVVQQLYAHSTDEAHVLRHRWSPGDVVVWDNGCVLHRADHAGVVGDRVMHRGMVAGYPAVAAQA